jgi:MFS family permease
MNLLGSMGLISYFVIGSIIWEKNPSSAFYMVALVSFGSILLAMALIREPVATQNDVQDGAGPLDYLKSIAQETNALKFFVAQFFWWLGFWIVTSFVVLFVVEELKAPEKDSFYILAVFSVTSTIFVLPLGMLGDRIGRKKILSVMLALWAVSEIFVGFSQNLNQAMIAVAVTAIPFAAIMGVGLAYLLDIIPPDRTAEFVGFSVISVAAAQIAGPLIGGAMIDTLGYRSIFPVTAIFMVIGLILLQFVGPRRETGTATED